MLKRIKIHYEKINIILQRDIVCYFFKKIMISLFFIREQISKILESTIHHLKMLSMDWYKIIFLYIIIYLSSYDAPLMIKK